MDKLLSSDYVERVTDCAAQTHYQIRRSLGAGGYGQVFEAWDSKLRRKVALKRLNSVALPHGPQRLLTEARAAASLNHSAFVQVFAIDQYEGAPVIVMELVSGATLSEHAHGVTMAPARALDIVRQVAEAMEQAHAANLVHSDIKPSNLMIEPTGRVRILDFGLARQIDPLITQSFLPDDTQGTIAYMAPERLLGESASPRSDVYALGVVLYELIAGQRPHAHLNGMALAAVHLQASSAQWDFDVGFDAVSAALVRAMTEREPVRRLQDMRAVLDRMATGPRPLPVHCAAGRPVDRRRTALRRRAPSLLLSLLLLGGIGWQLARLDPRTPIRAAFSSETAAVRAGMLLLETPDRQGCLEAAIERFRGVLENNPEHAMAAAGLSLAYSLRYGGDGHDEAWLSLADASAQQALRLDPQVALAHTAQAAVWEFQGRHPQALGEGERALQLDPLSAFAELGRARLLITMHRYADAEQVLRAAMLQHPDERRFADLLGTLHYQQSDYQQAERDFRHSLQLEPDAVYAYANLSAVLLQLGRDDEALKTVQQGLALRPDSSLYTNLGTILFARAQYPQAAAAFEQAAHGNPNNYLVWGNLADALRWIPGRTIGAHDGYQHASELLAALLQRSPNNITRASRMGLYLARLGQYASSQSWSERAIAAAPGSADVHFRAAIAFELAGRRAAAIENLLRARALGYAARLIDSEPDLVALKRDPHYQSLLIESAQ